MCHSYFHYRVRNNSIKPPFLTQWEWGVQITWGIMYVFVFAITCQIKIFKNCGYNSYLLEYAYYLSMGSICKCKQLFFFYIFTTHSYHNVIVYSSLEASQAKSWGFMIGQVKNQVRIGWGSILLEDFTMVGGQMASVKSWKGKVII